MVGGLHPTLPGEWYLNLLKSLRSLDPGLHIKAFTAIEIRHRHHCAWARVAIDEAGGRLAHHLVQHLEVFQESRAALGRDAADRESPA